MQDFFGNGNTAETPHNKLVQIFESIYGWQPNTDAFLGVNLQWPKFDLDTDYSRYFLSWHTEQFAVDWLIAQAQKVYPRPILVAFDGRVDANKIWPDNIQFVRWITWHDQIQQLIDRFGVCKSPALPKHKISSLSFRLSQYKNYVTAYLIANCNPDDLVLTYHQVSDKPEDNHGYPDSIPWLDALDLANLSPTFINFKDNFGWANNTPVANGSWESPPFLTALINCTNESFHYSQSERNGYPFMFPGPYITEKTWKPLLAGRPFVSVGQYHVYQELSQLGLKFDFGFPINFDSDPGDLTRIRDIFNTLDLIIQTPTSILYEQSLSSVMHNLQTLKSGEFANLCNLTNQSTKKQIRDFL